VKDKESFRRRRASHQNLNQEEKGKPPEAEPGGEGQARRKPQLTNKK
jgi:hypothetical protein